MRLRKPWVNVASVAVALIAAACGGSSSETNNPSSQTGTLTVWLMNGSAPQTVIDEVNADFKVKYPNVTVKVEIQQWGDIGTKLDTAFGGSTPPDVVELGNTLVAKYAAAGALEDITGKKTSFDNASTWLQSLTDSCTQNGKLYCVPYYAGSRAIIYRKDFFASAGVTPPDSLDSLLLDPKAGNAARKGQLGAVPIPSHNAGQSAPVFLGGSDLGVAAKSKHVDLANAWVQMLTGNKHMAEMATVGGVIPNNTSMLNLGTGINTTFYNAAKNSKFVPNSQNWAGVENANVLPDMLVKIFTKQQSIPDATKAASDRITTILNGGG